MQSETVNIFTANMKLVKTAVRQIALQKLPPMIDRSDLEQEGYIELYRCIKRYTNDGRAKFSTYADKCIRHRIKGKIADAHWGPKHSEAHRRKQNGQEFIKDMVNYESFAPITNDDVEDQWVFNISELDSVWNKFLDSDFIFNVDEKSKIKMLHEIDSLLKKKAPKNSTSGFAGVMYRISSELINKWVFAYRVLKKTIKVEGFSDANEAYVARQASLSHLREKLLET